MPGYGCHRGAWQSTVRVKGQVASWKGGTGKALTLVLGDSDLSVADREP